jgi:hypothetical protein
MDEPKTVIAAIERLEAERARRIVDKVERGEAVRETLYFTILLDFEPESPERAL